MSRVSSRRGTPNPSEAEASSNTERILEMLGDLSGQMGRQQEELVQLRAQCDRSQQAAGAAAPVTLPPDPVQQPLLPPGLQASPAAATAGPARARQGQEVAQPTQEQMPEVRRRISDLAGDLSRTEADRRAARQWLDEDASAALADYSDDGLDGPHAGLWADLSFVVDPSSEVPDASVHNGMFNGYETPVPYYSRNPFPRDEQFRDATRHYHPKRVGDSMSGDLVDQLHQKGYTAGSYEAQSLIPSLSYGHDTFEYTKQSASTALVAADAGDYKTAATGAINALIVIARQLDGTVQHQLERLAVLRKLNSGNQSELALFNNLYNSEHRATGGMGRTETRVDSGVQIGVTKQLVAGSAREQVAKHLPPPARTRNQIQTQREAGAPKVNKELHDALGRQQTQQQAAAPKPQGQRQPQQQQQQQQQRQQQRQQSAQPHQQQQQQQGGKGKGGGRGGDGGGRGGRGNGAPQAGTAVAASE